MGTHKLHSNDAGFSLIEILISMLIFLIISVGVGYTLVQSNQQMVNVLRILNAEQYGMLKSASSGSTVNPTFYVGLTGSYESITTPVTLTLNPVQPTQACTPGLLNGMGQAIGGIINSIMCIFGGCTTTTATPAPTSYTVSVPITAITTSGSQIAWWNP